MTAQVYSQLALRGFRRSGEYVYTPRCSQCKDCIPARIPVNDFKPNRSQKRCWNLNQDILVSQTEPKFKEEHFKLYRKYISHRHSGGGMDNPDPEQYLSFLTSSWSDTVFFEFRLQQTLLAVAVVDNMEQGLSAVYTFFDPDHSQRSLGVLAILWEIQEVKQRGLSWLFLGYWIKECKKMSYKGAYRPLEILRDGVWKRA